ncbi:MAG: hypothetical protein SP1CHLAM54_03590 [Chlamydiia bacterium]|nr:hypothetical protein [Chlamydiia bacterium]MCH9615275.1 hypothetical protein [Chlamydiia bacterium]MCH9628403.1 hypothetical protein [Chlamydiia bacterium]
MDKVVKTDVKDLLSLLKSHTLVLCIVILSYLANYTLNVYLARLLPPPIYGDIAVVLLILALLVPLAVFGTEISLVRYLPKYLANEDYGHAAGFIRWTFKMIGIMTLIILATGGLLIYGTAYMQQLNESKLHDVHLVYLSFWLIPLYALNILFSNILLVFNRHYIATMSKGFTLFGLMIGAIFLFLRFKGYTSESGMELIIVSCVGLACILSILFQSLFIYKVFPKEVIHAKPHYHKKEWFRSSFFVMGTTLVFSGMSAVQIILLEILGTYEADVGFFASLIVISSMILMLGGAVNMLLNPRISSLVTHHSSSHLQKMLNVLNCGKMIPGIILFVLIYFYGDFLLWIFGKDFTNSHSALCTLAAFYLFGLAFNSVPALLNFSHHQKTGFVISAAQLLYLILMNIILVPHFGLNGAIFALGSSIVLSSLAGAFFVKRYLGVKSFFFL